MNKIVVNEKIIRKKMIDLNIKSINELAIDTNVSKPTIYEYFNGKTPIPSPLLKICEYLEINPLDIFIEIDDSKGEEDV